MRYLIISLVIAVGFVARCYSQEEIKPHRNFAIRVNTLGVLNLDLIGDIEYCISKRIGVFIGGGSEYVQPYFDSPRYWFKKESEDYCKHTNWGVYAGMRISIPVWKFKGLALRPNLFFQRIVMDGNCWGPPPSVGPGISSLKSSEIGLVANLVYTQEFAKRFFIEPVIGFGPELLDREIVPYGHGRFLSWTLPLQLNLGVRL